MTMRRYVIIMGVLSLGMFMAGLAILAAGPAEPAPFVPPTESADEGGLPIIAMVDEFVLTASGGDTFRASSMNGKVWVADFIFTSCAGVCPVMTGAMAELHRTFRDDGRVGFVSISVDPATDTPEVLRDYSARYGADTDIWHFLTGELEDIHGISTRTFMVGSMDEPINHSARFILVDADGAIRGYYMGTDPIEVGRLEADMRRLLAGEGAS